MNAEMLAMVVEAALLAAGRPLSVDELVGLFEGDGDAPDRAAVRAALDAVTVASENRPFELVEVGSGFRLQVRREYGEWMGRLWVERPPRYSRPLMETLALVAYRQPISRGEIEDVRGVSLSTSIIKTLLEREWVRVVGHREVPGRPALFGTTRSFLDDFNIKSLDDLPPLSELRDLDRVPDDLFADLPPPDAPPDDGGRVDAAPATESDDPSPAAESPMGGDGFDVGGDGEAGAAEESASPAETGEAVPVPEGAPDDGQGDIEVEDETTPSDTTVAPDRA